MKPETARLTRRALLLGATAEYFVAPARFAEFVQACQTVIPASYQQLLNITLRYVNTDRDSVLAYAPEPRIAAVMLFSQEKTVRGETDMAHMTQALIERVLDIGGTSYLPYRRSCHAAIHAPRPSPPGSVKPILICCSATSWGTAISQGSETRGHRESEGRSLSDQVVQLRRPTWSIGTQPS